MIELTINYEPTAKGRARTVYRNGMAHTYTPEKTLNAQNFITAFLTPYKVQAFNNHVALKLTVIFYRHKSIWLPKKESLPFRKPDLDNFLKLILDSMNGVLFYDDAQITTINMQKRWSPTGEGYIVIRLEEDTNETL